MLAKLLYFSRSGKLVSLLFFACLSSQAQDKSELHKLMSSIVTWGDELNTPGTELAAHLMIRQTRNGAEYGFYDFYLTGAPRDQSYTIFQWPLGKSEPQEVLAAYVSADGRLCMKANECHDTSGPFVMLAFLSSPGLPHRIEIVSKDGKYKAVVMIVPKRIIAEDKGCSVEVIRAREDFSFAVIRGKGFPPNEEIQYLSHSAGEELKGSFKTNAHGEFTTGLGAGVKGKQKGTDEIGFKASGCAPFVSYHWGTLEE